MEIHMERTLPWQVNQDSSLSREYYSKICIVGTICVMIHISWHNNCIKSYHTAKIHRSTSCGSKEKCVRANSRELCLCKEAHAGMFTHYFYHTDATKYMMYYYQCRDKQMQQSKQTLVNCILNLVIDTLNMQDFEWQHAVMTNNCIQEPSLSNIFKVINTKTGHKISAYEPFRSY